MFATVPVTVDFVMSSLLTDSTVMCLRLLFRELGDGRGRLFNRMIWVITEIKDDLPFQVEHCVRHMFHSESGFHDEGRGSVHGGESHQQGSGKGGVLFLLHLFWMGGIRE